LRNGQDPSTGIAVIFGALGRLGECFSGAIPTLPGNRDVGGREDEGAFNNVGGGNIVSGEEVRWVSIGCDPDWAEEPLRSRTSGDRVSGGGGLCRSDLGLDIFGGLRLPVCGGIGGGSCAVGNGSPARAGERKGPAELEEFGGLSGGNLIPLLRDGDDGIGVRCGWSNGDG